MRQYGVMFFLMLLVLTSCKKEKENEIKIGLLIHSTESSRWEMDINYIQQRAEELGVSVILKDADGDENLQLKQASELLNEGVDALMVVAVNQNTAAGIVRNAHEHKVPVIGYDRLIKNSDLDYLVSFEYESVGRQMVEYSISKKSKGNYILVWGDAGDANAIFVKNGIEKAIKPYVDNGDVNIIYKTYIDGWLQTQANHTVNKVLDFSDEKIDAAIVCNDPMAVGVYNALSAHGYAPNDVTITGQDATLEFVHSMLDGGMSMSICKPIKELAYGAVDAVYDLLVNNEEEDFDKTVNNGRKDVPAKLFSSLAVDIDNFESELIQKGVYTKDEVFIKD